MSTTATRSRRAREKAARKAALLDAAEAVFTRDGLDAARVDDVARAAEISKGLVYAYFADKADLCDAVALRALGRLSVALGRAAYAGGPAFDRLAHFAAAYAAVARERPADFALLHYRVGESPPYAEGSHAAACHEATMALFALLEKVLADGQADGSVRADLDPRRAALALWSGVHGFVSVAAQSNVEAWYGVAADGLVQDGLALLLDGVRSR